MFRWMQSWDGHGRMLSNYLTISKVQVIVETGTRKYLRQF